MTSLRRKVGSQSKINCHTGAAPLKETKNQQLTTTPPHYDIPAQVNSRNVQHSGNAYPNSRKHRSHPNRIERTKIYSSSESK